MADEIDRAQERDEFFRSLALGKHKENGFTGMSAAECIECGETIPKARRMAVPGCCRCVDCQAEFERRSE